MRSAVSDASAWLSPEPARSNSAALTDMPASDVTKKGAGTATFTGDNNYGGMTTVEAGVLEAGSNTALGSTAGETTVDSGARVVLADGVTVTGDLLGGQRLELLMDTMAAEAATAATEQAS